MDNVIKYLSFYILFFLLFSCKFQKNKDEDNIRLNKIQIFNYSERDICDYGSIRISVNIRIKKNNSLFFPLPSNYCYLTNEEPTVAYLYSNSKDTFYCVREPRIGDLENDTIRALNDSLITLTYLVKKMFIGTNLDSLNKWINKFDYFKMIHPSNYVFVIGKTKENIEYYFDNKKTTLDDKEFYKLMHNFKPPPVVTLHPVVENP